MDDAPLVVIIEDDHFAAFLFKQTLNAHGYAVAINSGETVDLPALVSLKPAALLVDLHLSEGDGVQLLRRLRTVRSLRHVPAALITGDYFTDATVSREIEKLGIEMYFKPLWDDQLLSVVAGLVKRGLVALDEASR
ncbi:MAG: response regulator [Acidimicrobiia bacterium]|nr:response regulator [Acidimicrobiia bacterium]